MAIYTGTDAGEQIVGGVEDDLLQGLEGDDVLDGGEGIDRLEGGLGDDRLIVGQTRREVDGIDG
jgi:serralysin